LINPQGIIIGKEGVVHTAGFIASTLNICDCEFLSNKDLHFSGSQEGTILNQGSLVADSGDVILIGYYVDNQGKIEAPQGVASIAVGEDVVVQLEGSQRVAIHAKLSSLPQEGAGVSNSGSLRALRSELQTDGNPYAWAINHSGRIEALGIREKEGEIYLFSNHVWY